MNVKTVFLGVVLATAGIAASAGERYDLESQFPTSANDNSSVWSCRYQADGVPNNLARDGNYEILPFLNTQFAGAAGLVGWSVDGSHTEPAVCRNFSGSPISFGANLTIGVGVVHAHPNPSQLVVMSWLAPHDGVVSVRASFTDLNGSMGNGVDWHIEQGAVNLAGGSMANGAGVSVTQILSRVCVVAGDRIHFIVSPKDSDYNADSTRVTAQIKYGDLLNLDINGYDPANDSVPDASATASGAAATGVVGDKWNSLVIANSTAASVTTPALSLVDGVQRTLVSLKIASAGPGNLLADSLVGTPHQLNALLQDYVVAIADPADGCTNITLTVNGLRPSEYYDLYIMASAGDFGNALAIAANGQTNTLIGGWAGSYEAGRNYLPVFDVLANGSGAITATIIPTGGQPAVLNGIQLFGPIPLASRGTVVFLH